MTVMLPRIPYIYHANTSTVCRLYLGKDIIQWLFVTPSLNQENGWNLEFKMAFLLAVLSAVFSSEFRVVSSQELLSDVWILYFSSFSVVGTSFRFKPFLFASGLDLFTAD